VAILGLPGQGGGQAEVITGRWTLNEGQSDDLESAMRRGTTGMQRVSGSRDPPGWQVATALQRHLKRDRSALEIIRFDSGVTVISGDGWVGSFPSDGSTGVIALSGGMEAEVKAEWQNDDLRLEYRGAGNTSFVEEYSMDKETGALKVEFRLIARTSGLNIRVRRTYDRTGGVDQPGPR